MWAAAVAPALRRRSTAQVPVPSDHGDHGDRHLAIMGTGTSLDLRSLRRRLGVEPDPPTAAVVPPVLRRKIWARKLRPQSAGATAERRCYSTAPRQLQGWGPVGTGTSLALALSCRHLSCRQSWGQAHARLERTVHDGGLLPVPDLLRGACVDFLAPSPPAHRGQRSTGLVASARIVAVPRLVRHR